MTEAYLVAGEQFFHEDFSDGVDYTNNFLFKIPVVSLSSGGSRVTMNAGIYHEPRVRIFNDKAPASIGNKEISFGVLMQADNMDELLKNWEKVENLLNRAVQGAGPYPKGTGVCYMERLNDSSEFACWDVISGVASGVDLSFPGQPIWGMALQLAVSPFSRGKPQLLPYDSVTRNNGPQSYLWLPNVPGDAEGLVEFHVKDLSGTGNWTRIHIGRKSYLTMQPNDFTSFYNRTDSAVCGGSFTQITQLLSNAGQFQNGLFDVWALIKDHSALLSPVAQISAASVHGGSIPNFTRQYWVAGIDSNGDQSLLSPVATVAPDPTAVELLDTDNFQGTVLSNKWIKTAAVPFLPDGSSSQSLSLGIRSDDTINGSNCLDIDYVSQGKGKKTQPGITTNYPSHGGGFYKVVFNIPLPKVPFPQGVIVSLKLSIPVFHDGGGEAFTSWVQGYFNYAPNQGGVSMDKFATDDPFVGATNSIPDLYMGLPTDGSITYLHAITEWTGGAAPQWWDGLLGVGTSHTSVESVETGFIKETNSPVQPNNLQLVFQTFGGPGQSGQFNIQIEEVQFRRTDGTVLQTISSFSSLPAGWSSTQTPPDSISGSQAVLNFFDGIMNIDLYSAVYTPPSTTTSPTDVSEPLLAYTQLIRPIPASTGVADRVRYVTFEAKLLQADLDPLLPTSTFGMTFTDLFGFEGRDSKWGFVNPPPDTAKNIWLEKTYYPPFFFNDTTTPYYGSPYQGFGSYLGPDSFTVEGSNFPVPPLGFQDPFTVPIDGSYHKFQIVYQLSSTTTDINGVTTVNSDGGYQVLMDGTPIHTNFNLVLSSFPNMSFNFGVASNGGTSALHVRIANYTVTALPWSDISELGLRDILSWSAGVGATSYNLYAYMPSIGYIEWADVGDILTFIASDPASATIIATLPSETNTGTNGQLRARIASGHSASHIFQIPPTQAKLSNSIEEWIKLGTLPLPPGNKPDGSAVDNWTLFIDGKSGGTGTAQIEVLAIGLMPADEEGWTGITASAPNLGEAVEWRIGTNRFGFSYARLYRISDGTFLGNASVTGHIGAMAGDNFFPVIVEADDGSGHWSSDKTNLAWQGEVRYVGRWHFDPAPGLPI